MQELKLSSKIRKTFHSQKAAEFSENFRFYKKYASFVLEALKTPRFQKFLKWIIKREEIEEDVVEDVQVKVFPFKKENGNGLAGRYKSKGLILIYPKRFKFCQGLAQEIGKEKTFSYIKNRARATLIHELLHVKYASNEKKVRKLTKKYFNIFAEKSESAYDISKILFKE